MDNLNMNDKVDLQILSRQMEVLLHASETPLTDDDLLNLLNINNDTFTKVILTLKERLTDGVLTLVKTASGYRLQIRDEYGTFIRSKFPERGENLSSALLETLSVIAYKQPVTRSDIEQIRGVAVSSHILRQLFDKGWIIEKGYKDTLGRPTLLHTTNAFLDAFGLQSLQELPELPDLNSFKL